MQFKVLYPVIPFSFFLSLSVIRQRKIAGERSRERQRENREREERYPFFDSGSFLPSRFYSLEPFLHSRLQQPTCHSFLFYAIRVSLLFFFSFFFLLFLFLFSPSPSWEKEKERKRNREGRGEGYKLVMQVVSLFLSFISCALCFVVGHFSLFLFSSLSLSFSLFLPRKMKERERESLYCIFCLMVLSLKKFHCLLHFFLHFIFLSFLLFVSREREREKGEKRLKRERGPFLIMSKRGERTVLGHTILQK